MLRKTLTKLNVQLKAFEIVLTISQPLSLLIQISAMIKTESNIFVKYLAKLFPSLKIRLTFTLKAFQSFLINGLRILI